MGTPKLSAEGAKFEAPKAAECRARRRENRSAEGAVRGGVVSSPSGVRGRAPAANAFCHILGSRKHLFGQQNAFEEVYSYHRGTVFGSFVTIQQRSHAFSP